METPPIPAPSPAAPDAAASIDLFEDRYGLGAHARLLTLFKQPCVTFADIADRFGVTRECVRQWYSRLLPDGPTGHERQRQCRQYQRKRDLMKDDLFLGFYRRFRTHVPAQRLTLIPARDGFRRRAVRVERYVIVLKRARVSAGTDRSSSYRLVDGVGQADFVYYDLNGTDFLLLPRHVLDQAAATFVDADGTALQPFKNTFGALGSWQAG